MRVDVPFATLALAASSVVAHDAAKMGGAWSKDHKKVAALEDEIKSLRQELDAASQYTCDSGVATSPVAGGAGASTATEYSTEYSTVVNTQYYTVSKPGEPQTTAYNGPGGAYTTTYAQETDYSTVTELNTVTYSTINTYYVSPVAPSVEYTTDYYSTVTQYTTAGVAAPDTTDAVDAPETVYTSTPAPIYTSNPDYYAPAPAATAEEETTTITVIVTPGQATPTGDAGASTHICYETYVGSGSIPAPVSTIESTSTISMPSISTKSATSSNSMMSSSSSMAKYPAGNSTTAMGTAGVTTSSVFVPSGSVRVPAGTGASNSASSTSSGVPVGTGASTSASSTSSGSSASSSTASSTSASASATQSAVVGDCSTICSELTSFNGWEVTPMTCTQLSAGTNVSTPEGQSSVGCATTFIPAVDICQITLNVKTSGIADTYMEVWLPNGDENSWNGRTMSTDNGGLNGCVHYVDMQYVSGMGFASIGDNAGHNGSSFDGTWMLNDNEAIIDWSYRARHASIEVGKQVVNEFYSKQPEYSYYIGCSTGGAQGMQSAQMFPDDFDGIISGSSAADFNHLQSWSAHFHQITGEAGNDTFLTLDEWTNIVEAAILAQCDEPIDGVADGILEDPTQCEFDTSVLPLCASDSDTGCLTASQIQTVEDVFTPLYNTSNGNLIYPSLLYGSEVDAFRLGLLSGSINGIARDFFRGGVYNDSSFDITTIDQSDYDRATALDPLHGYPSAFDGDLSAFEASNGKMIMYHGMADPLTSGTNSQRYYLKVAQAMGLGHDQLDDFFRFFRISGMAHCGVGGISGAGAWMFGQSLAASPATNNIVQNLVDWVENDEAPETLLGTKFWYDTPSLGIEFQRGHCRFPYRTTYRGGDSTLASSWGCDLIQDWEECEGEYCNPDGTFD